MEMPDATILSSRLPMSRGKPPKKSLRIATVSGSTSLISGVPGGNGAAGVERHGDAAVEVVTPGPVVELDGGHQVKDGRVRLEPMDVVILRESGVRSPA